MRHNFVTKFSKLFFACCFVVFVFLNSQNALAVYEGPRTENNGFDSVTFDTSENVCDVDGIDFDPFSDNKDMKWVLSNPTCAGFMVGGGFALMAMESAGSWACQAPQKIAEIALQKASGVPVSPKTIKRRASEAAKCGALIAANNYAQAGLCCSGMVASSVATGVITGALAALHSVAQDTFDNAKICGYKWNGWHQETDETTRAVKWMRGKGPHKICLENAFLNGSNTCVLNTNQDMTNQSYREYIYGGVEYEDNSDDACKNPESWTKGGETQPGKPDRMRILGYDSDKQRYYMTGPGVAPVFACFRFRLEGGNNDRSAIAAYECCKQRSQSAICIENKTAFGSGHKFCSIGSKCAIAGVTFDIYQSKVESNYVCAKTYSLCPYDHQLGGGTETKKMSEADPTQVENFCQVMNHCSKLPILPRIRSSDLTGAYISAACRDMRGDSQNVYGYSAELIPVSMRGFSAPMVQCFKETMENIFLHKAGFTKCKNPDEFPDGNDECVSGYDFPGFKKGDDLPGESFFIKIQNSLQDFIKMCVTLAVVAFGFGVLLAVPNQHIKKDMLMMFILKIALVMYFAVGDAWQAKFMTGVLGSASYLSDITFQVDENADYTKLDGCQFPRYNYADSNYATKYDDPSYPPGKEYLRVWDTLDCKLSRALGFGPEVSVPNLIFMILGGFLTGGLGIIFFVGAFMFAFCLLSVIVRALHVFVMSTTLVVLLIYVSPLTITAAMFNKTKGIFDKWWKELLGQTLQPLILFAYLGIFITMFDQLIIGADVTFTASNIVVNGVSRVDNIGQVTPKTINCGGEAANTSIYCIFRISDIKTLSALAPLGVGLPLLGSLNQDKLHTIIKAAFIMFILMQFMDKIADIANALMGVDNTINKLAGGLNMGMAGKALSIGRGIQKRGMGAAKKIGGAVARKGIGKAKSIGNALGNKGRSIAENTPVGPNADAAVKDGERDAGGSTASKPDKSGETKKEGADASSSQGRTQPKPRGGADTPGAV